MLRFDQKRIRIMGLYSRDSFERELMTLAHNRFPELVESLGSETRLLEFVKTALKKAEDYGFRGRDQARRCVEFLIQYGLDFGANPETKWAMPTLVRQDICAPLRLDILDVAERKAGKR
jgi:hypothetical protein